MTMPIPTEDYLMHFKYIKKIKTPKGTRYFYTVQELQEFYKQGKERYLSDNPEKITASSTEAERKNKSIIDRKARSMAGSDRNALMRDNNIYREYSETNKNGKRTGVLKTDTKRRNEGAKEAGQRAVLEKIRSGKRIYKSAKKEAKKNFQATKKQIQRNKVNKEAKKTSKNIVSAASGAASMKKKSGPDYQAVRRTLVNNKRKSVKAKADDNRNTYSTTRETLQKNARKRKVQEGFSKGANAIPRMNDLQKKAKKTQRRIKTAKKAYDIYRKYSER